MVGFGVCDVIEAKYLKQHLVRARIFVQFYVDDNELLEALVVGAADVRCSGGGAKPVPSVAAVAGRKRNNILESERDAAAIE